MEEIVAHGVNGVLRELSRQPLLEEGEERRQARCHTQCCIFDNEKKKIVLYYTGDITVAELTAYIKGKLPRYLVPNVTKQLEALPLTPNGKIDRNGLKTLYAGL